MPTRNQSLALYASLLVAGWTYSQAPAPGQGGIVNGVPREYDSFLSNFQRLEGPGAIRLPPPAQLPPLRSSTAEVTGYLGRSAVPSSRSFQPGWGERPSPWVHQAKTGLYVAVGRTSSGTTYYWVYRRQSPQYFYCYSPLRERYVGLYDIALRLYRPFNARSQRWEEAGSPPIMPPPERPAASTRPAPADIPTVPKPPPFRIGSAAPLPSREAGP